MADDATVDPEGAPAPPGSPGSPDTDVVDGVGVGEAPAGGDAPDHDRSQGATSEVEDLIRDLEQVSAERDEYLDLARRTQAEFENHRKRVAKQQADEVARSSAGLVEQLLPVLDACDGAIAHGSSEVEPIFAALLQTLEKQGLERIDPRGEAFDPNRHEAVMHEPAAEGDDDEGTVVSDVMRPGYGWKGLVVRPAMVKVRG